MIAIHAKTYFSNNNSVASDMPFNIPVPSLSIATGRLACDARKLGYCSLFDKNMVRDLLARGAPAEDLLMIGSRNPNFDADDFNFLKDMCEDQLYSGTLREKPCLRILAQSFTRDFQPYRLSHGFYVLFEYLMNTYDYSGDELRAFYSLIDWKGYLKELEFVKLLVKRDMFFCAFGGRYSRYNWKLLPALRIILAEGLIMSSERDLEALRECDIHSKTVFLLMFLQRPEYEIICRSGPVSKIFSKFLVLDARFWRTIPKMSIRFIEELFFIDLVFCHV